MGTPTGSDIKRIGVLTGGGDCPGLNAVIRAVTKDAINHGIEVLGIEDGFLGLIEDRIRPLRTRRCLEHPHPWAGTILGSNNKTEPKEIPIGTKGRQAHRSRISPTCADAPGRRKIERSS